MDNISPANTVLLGQIRKRRTRSTPRQKSNQVIAPSMIIFPLSANSDLLTLLFAHISFRHRAILHFPALPLDHFPIGLQRHVWHCKGLNLLARIIWYRSKAKIDRTLHRHQVANTPPAQCSNSLPHEIVEMTIGDLIHDV